MVSQTLETLTITDHRGGGRIIAPDPWELPTSLKLPPPNADGQYRHVIVVFNPITIDEQTLLIYTKTPFHSDVQRELELQKSNNELSGYYYRATLESPCGF